MADDDAARALTPYAGMYSDAVAEWRELGARYKAANILEVCRGRRFTRVLEWGAGEGAVLKFLAAAGTFLKLHALEISESGIQQIRKRNLPGIESVEKFDGYRTPYGDNEFDMAYCTHVVEHVEHPRLLLREIRRISRFQVFEVPLDYAPGIDSDVQRFLSYGHINIYTPSLFRFLLKSEGFRVIEERLTHTDVEVMRFNWYRNLKLEKSWLTELKLRTYPLRRKLRRLQIGRLRYEETGYSAYTCLVEGVGSLKILG